MLYEFIVLTFAQTSTANAKYSSKGLKKYILDI